jgi:hypothetical protein
MHRVMPSFTDTRLLSFFDPSIDSAHHLQQLTSASIIGNWNLDFHNTSIALSADCCTAIAQLCNCHDLSFQGYSHLPTQHSHSLIAAAMAIADVLFMPWPTWAKLSFVRRSHLMLCDLKKLTCSQVLGGLLVCPSLFMSPNLTLF